MAKYIVYGLVDASIKIGEYETDDPTEAIEMAMDDDNRKLSVSICAHCSKELEVGDIIKYVYEEVD